MKPAKFDRAITKGRKVVVNLFAQHFQKYFLVVHIAKSNYFVGRNTALSEKKKGHPPTENLIVGPTAMAAAIHFRLHFLNIGCSIQSSLKISGDDLHLIEGEDRPRVHHQKVNENCPREFVIQT